MKKYYAAYGSNLNKEMMKKRCPDAEAVGAAVLDGFRLCCKGQPGSSYLTIEEEEGYKVLLGIWKISDADEIELDEYEEYPELYRKEWVNLEVRKSKEAPASIKHCLIYIMNGNFEIMPPTEEYRRICYEGYRDFGFDQEVLQGIW